MRILLTGATGFLGAEILTELIEQKEVSVVAWGRDQARIQALQSRFAASAGRLMIEMRDLFAPRPPLSGFDVLIHAAALRSSIAGHDSVDLTRVNVEGTRHIVRLAEQASCQQILYISTQAVYGSEGAPWSEDAPLHPETAYAVSKRAGEVKALQAHDIEVSILRISRLYGITPFTPWDQLPGCFAKAVSRGEALTIHGTGEQRFDLIHVRDAARCIATVALQLNQDEPSIFNVGGGSSICLNEFVELFSQLAPMFGFPPVTIQYTPSHSQEGVHHLELATARVRKAFGWLPKIGLREGLSEYLDVLSSRDSLRTRQ